MLDGRQEGTMIHPSSPWEAFALHGDWHKGNLHCHSTRSDGALEPDDVAMLYRQRGYSVLALSDHRRVTDLSHLAGPDFLPLAAMELDGKDPLTNGPYDMLALGLHELRTQPDDLSLPRLLEEVAADGGETLFCHPYWLGTCATDLLSLEGCLGLEVYVKTCDVLVGKGCAVETWDHALQRGKRYFGFASDDAHWRWQEPDFGYAWIMLKLPRLDEASVLSALRYGHFYSSTGPSIEDLRLEGNMVRLRCSPAAAVHFIAQAGVGRRVVPLDGGSLTEATYELTGEERYLRVECIGNDGTRAWSNPLWLDGDKEPTP